MLGNLRGIRESGTIFMAPTYLYIVAILAMVGIGSFGWRPARCRTTRRPPSG